MIIPKSYYGHIMSISDLTDPIDDVQGRTYPYDDFQSHNDPFDERGFLLYAKNPRFEQKSTLTI